MFTKRNRIECRVFVPYGVVYVSLLAQSVPVRLFAELSRPWIGNLSQRLNRDKYLRLVHNDLYYSYVYIMNLRNLLKTLATLLKTTALSAVSCQFFAFQICPSKAPIECLKSQNKYKIYPLYNSKLTYNTLIKYVDIV